MALLKRKYFLIPAIYLCYQCAYAQKQNTAGIIIDPDQKQKAISPLIFGQFIELLGRSIHGGVYDESSNLSDENGFRKDVLEKAKNLHPPLLRYPGGTVTKIYHWQDGVGPKSSRPKRPNLIWGGIEDNHFGTAEFVRYCRAIGAEPFLVVNMSTGTPEEASDWVEYCNGTGDTYYANLRRSHGYREPFNVKYWGIGNEEYATEDAGKDQDVNKYIEDAWMFVKLMKLQSPSIKLTLVGNSADMNWNRKVLKEMHPVIDFLSVHYYASSRDTGFASLLKSINGFNSLMDSMRLLLKDIPDQVTSFPKWYRFPPRDHPLKLAIDEWGIWQNSPEAKGPYHLEVPYSWSDALGVAQFLNNMFRNSDMIGLATWAQMVNVLAPIMTNEKGSFTQTVYTALQAYRDQTEKNLLPIEINGKDKKMDAVATISDEGKKIVVAVINVSATDKLDLNVSFVNANQGNSFHLSGRTTYSSTSFAESNSFNRNIVIEQKESYPSNPTKTGQIILPPASISFFEFDKIK